MQGVPKRRAAASWMPSEPGYKPTTQHKQSTEKRGLRCRKSVQKLCEESKPRKGQRGKSVAHFRVRWYYQGTSAGASYSTAQFAGRGGYRVARRQTHQGSVGARRCCNEVCPQIHVGCFSWASSKFLIYLHMWPSGQRQSPCYDMSPAARPLDFAP